MAGNSGARYSLIVNGVQYDVELPRLLGYQIKALAAIPDDHALVVEGAGSDVDRLLADDGFVSLEAGVIHVYTKPPTLFGALRHRAC